MARAKSPSAPRAGCSTRPSSPPSSAVRARSSRRTNPTNSLLSTRSDSARGSSAGCSTVSSRDPGAPARAVLFDLGGVLVDWNPRHLYRRLFADEQAMEEFLETVCTRAWNEEQDLGRPFAEGVRLLTEQYPHWAEEIRAYDARWHEMLR